MDCSTPLLRPSPYLLPGIDSLGGRPRARTSTDSFKTDQALATMRMEIRIDTMGSIGSPARQRMTPAAMITPTEPRQVAGRAEGRLERSDSRRLPSKGPGKATTLMMRPKTASPSFRHPSLQRDRRSSDRFVPPQRDTRRKHAVDQSRQNLGALVSEGPSSPSRDAQQSIRRTGRERARSCRRSFTHVARVRKQGSIARTIPDHSARAPQQP